MNNKSMIMTRAWAIAKDASKKSGYSAKEYFAISLRMAWAESRKDGNPMKEKFEELITKYRMIIRQDGKMVVLETAKLKKNAEDMQFVSSHAGEIKAHLIAKAEEEEKAFRARLREEQEKLNAIEGLSEIEAAKEDLNSWYREFNKSFDDVGGFNVRDKPNYDFDAMYAKYPRAAAYLKAKEWSEASHYVKSTSGAKAAQKILDGEDYAIAICEMETEWEKHCKAHMFD